jgi:hypothetical protein
VRDVHRVPLTLRALFFVPLLAAGVDQVRAAALCGSDAQTCLEAAGRGWIGVWGVALIALYALVLGLLVARAAAPVARPSFARLWAVGTAGVAAACGGQALVAGTLGGGALGGGWLGLLVLCVVAGAVLAAALRAAPEVARALRPVAPRTQAAQHSWWRSTAAVAAGAGRGPAPRRLGRAPPAFI